MHVTYARCTGTTKRVLRLPNGDKTVKVRSKTERLKRRHREPPQKCNIRSGMHAVCTTMYFDYPTDRKLQSKLCSFSDRWTTCELAAVYFHAVHTVDRGDLSGWNLDLNSVPRSSKDFFSFGREGHFQLTSCHKDRVTQAQTQTAHTARQHRWHQWNPFFFI